ncbi:hypothetical protein GCM10009133_34020 [Cocleimonas flava]|jgi:hypothetical protein
MNLTLFNWITLISGTLGVLLIIIFLLTGKKNQVLRVSGSVLIIVTVISSFISRM